MGHSDLLNHPVVKVESLKIQCDSLYQRMSRDPDRPSWELEFCSIFIQLAEIVALLDNKLAVTSVNLEDISKRVTSLESRYSELLYHLSSRSS